MSQDRHQSNRQKTAEKKYQQLNETPAHKLKVNLEKKIRHSNRKSLIPRNRAAIKFQSLIEQKKIEKRESQGDKINLELQQELDQHYEKTKKMSIVLDEDIQIIDQLRSQISYAKTFRDELRQVYFKKKNMLQQQKQYLSQISDTYALKKQLIDLQHEEKKNIYELSCRQDQIKHSNKLGRQKIKNLSALLDKNLSYFTSVTEQVKELQLKKKDLALALAKKQQALEEAKYYYNLQQSQIFVLKIQTNSNLCSGMIYNKIGIDRKLLLEKDYFQWDKAKERKLTFEDLKRFVLIQLCHGWKTMLRKLSYQSSQYQVLFGEIKNETVLEDLRRFLSYDKVRSSYKKSPKAIIYYSEVKVQADRKQIILNLFRNFDNGIIHINSVEFIQFDGIVELEIIYTYLNDCQLKQRFTFQQHNVINRQKLIKDLKSVDRRTFLLVEIPFVALRQDLQRYDQVFDLIRKKTGNNMTGSLKSLK